MAKSNYDTPAILGGSPAVTLDQTAANRWPLLGPEDEQAILAVLRDGDISTHPVIRELERDYAAFAGMPYALAHNNGTAALLAAFFALDLEPGDEIIVPSATFWASVLPMLWFGLVPVFCESEDERLGPDPADIERRITSRTRAIVVVHLWGMPCRMTEILALARKHDLRIVEDASHAHGATWRGRPCGSLGDIGVFSLQGDKLAPAGEGGIFLTRETKYLERAMMLGDITRIIEIDGPSRRFAATSFGIKTRIAPLSAALACAQLKRLPERNARRNRNIAYLSAKLEEHGFETFQPPAHIERAYFEFIVRARPERVELPRGVMIQALQAEGCWIATPRYPLIHQQPFFTEGHAHKALRLPPELAPAPYLPDALPVTTAANGELIRLPSFPQAAQDLLDQYVLAFDKVFGAADIIARNAASQAGPAAAEQATGGRA
jgi:perosamine synthetase